jgi:nicotinic acid mononucleotide adenylyltransferase
MFKKKFDHNDINNFLPCNRTIGTVDFFNKKFKNNMPDYICELLAVETLVEDEEEKQKQKQEILNKKKEYTNKLLAELEERANNDNEIISEIKDLSIDNNE